MKQYLKLSENSSFLKSPAGLSDRQYILKSLIYLSDSLSCTLILPNFLLHGMHQVNNKEHTRSNLSEYFDFDKTLIKGKPFRFTKNTAPTDGEVNEILVNNYSFWDNIMHKFGGDNDWNIPKDLKILKSQQKDIRSWYGVDTPFHPSILKKAKELRSLMPTKLASFKWRLGDRLIQDNSINGIKYSMEDYKGIVSPKNLIATFKRINAPKDIYLLTNAQSDNLFVREIKKSKEYNFIFNHDFKELKEIQQQDNYKCFLIERAIEISNCPDCWCIEFEEMAETFYNN